MCFQDSMCGVDPQGLKRLAGSMCVCLLWPADLVTLEACRLGFVKLLPEQSERVKHLCF